MPWATLLVSTCVSSRKDRALGSLAHLWAIWSTARGSTILSAFLLLPILALHVGLLGRFGAHGGRRVAVLAVRLTVLVTIFVRFIFVEGCEGLRSELLLLMNALHDAQVERAVARILRHPLLQHAVDGAHKLVAPVEVEHGHVLLPREHVSEAVRQELRAHLQIKQPLLRLLHVRILALDLEAVQSAAHIVGVEL